jgi:predicted phosphodiesterase
MKILYFSGHSHLAVIQKVNNEDFVFSGHSHLAVIQQVNNEDFVFFRTLTLGCDSEG